jgi:hypothetical protein
VSMQRKFWRKPLLTVLVRAQPSENVLTGRCKQNVAMTYGPGMYNDRCRCSSTCGNCSTAGRS